MGSSPTARTISLIALLALAGCDRRPDDVPVVVSVLGKDHADRVIAGATAQGLVRFDAAGQAEPALAERWNVIDDGRSYIFRLAPLAWGASDRSATAAEVVASLRRAVARSNREPSRSHLTVVSEVVEMTPQVIELRLRRPQPELLKLLAQPELGLMRRRPSAGTGPFRVARRDRNLLRLVPAADAQDVDAAERVDIRRERASLAIARFRAGRSDLVDGGSVDDWPLVALADIPPAAIRIDPAAGLFGLAVVSREGFLADPLNRAALGLALQAANIPAGFRTEWTAADTLLPDRLDSSAAPALPIWGSVAADQRLAAGRAQVARYAGPRATLRIALPAGAGGTQLWGRIAGAFARIGITAARVAPTEAAELRLIDAVAPYDSARWYLRTACVRCSPEAAALIEAARLSNDLPERAQRIAEADAALAADVAFLPIARPLRWSLVAQRLRAWQPNARAWHPLNHLRDDPN